MTSGPQLQRPEAAKGARHLLIDPFPKILPHSEEAHPQAMPETPKDKGLTRYMPEGDGHEDDKGVEIDTSAISTQGDINVVSQETDERDVPRTPKLS